jgi:tetratricopeptide (TPR) repeat protein
MLQLRLLYASMALAGACSSGYAQSILTLPEASQRAVVSQRLGLTDITVTYHRPLAGTRKIWGGIVPYGQVWRAGANENTTIEFSTPVTVEGQPLAKGIYGLHMMPDTDSWTVIFSKNSSSWGSFTYNQAEDALRVTVKPQPAETHNALTYDFDEVKPDSAVVKLQWEKLAVPFTVSANEIEVTLASLREELRSGKQYVWESGAEAAQYCLANKIALEEGLGWANKSIAIEERFENLILKADLLKALNHDTESASVREKAMSAANVTQIYFYARNLQAQNQPSQAVEIFKVAVKRFPDHWLGHMAAARLASASGDYANALKEVKIVQGLEIPDAQKANLVNLARRLENKEDINR